MSWIALFACTRRQLLRTTALVLALPLLPLGTASAQVNCNGIGAQNCALATDQYPYFQPFATLPLTTAGKALLAANLDAVNSIYLNATVSQQNQAVQNSNTSSFYPQYNIWAMLSNVAVSATNTVTNSMPAGNLLAVGLNAASFQNGSAGAGFVPLAGGLTSTSSLATTMTSQLPGQGGVYGNITTLLQNVVGIGNGNSNYITQIDAMKQSFSSYNTEYLWVQHRQTPWATYPYPPAEGPPPLFPASTDMRPYQISTTIADAPWSASNPQLWNNATSGELSQQSQWSGNQKSQSFLSGHSTYGNTTALLYAIMMPQAYQSLMVAGLEFGLSRNVLGLHYPLDIVGGRVLAYYAMTQLLSGNQAYANAYSNIDPAVGNFSSYVNGLASQLQAATGSAPVSPYAACASALASCIAGGVFPTAGQLTAANQAYATLTTYGLQGPLPATSTTTAPANSNVLIASRFPYLSSQQQLDVLSSTMLPAGVPLDDGTGWARLNLYAAAGGYGAFNNGMVTVTMNAAAGGFNAFDFWGNNIGGTGGLTLQGSGTLVLGGDNFYTGGTVVGCAQGNCTPTLGLSGSLLGDLTIYPNATFVSRDGGYAVSPTSTLSNGGLMVMDLVNAGTATNNGTITGSVVNYGSFGGTGTTGGNLQNFGVVAPGNSIGTLSVAGNFTNMAGGTLNAEVSGSGQGDLLNVGGTATLQGGNVFVYAQPGTTFAPSTTWRILNAAGGLSGTFASVNELYPFLLSSLSYDANNVYLTLDVGGFAAAAATPTQAAVGTVIDANVNSASGDFAAVLSAMATGVQSNASAQYVLQQLSGNNYAGFSSSMVQGAQLFMNNFAGQGGGGAPGGGSRVALAEACDVACDTLGPATWGAWGGALGGLGTIGAGQPVGGVTYNAGGFAAGLDRALTDSIRVGVTAGYTTGTQWVSGFDGQGRTDTFQVGLYGGFARDKVYADALLGYAYSWNQMWRQIQIPGLSPRTALGQTGANQWYGQLEGGYRFDLGTSADAYVTPFARLQGYTGTQNGFTETGAQSLNLTVAQQTTNSLRSVLGATLGGAVDLGWRDKLALQLRLGWSHEYASTARPVTATLAGAAAMPFTTLGVSPTRDGAVLGFGANTAIADATSVYLRYEGNVAGQDSAHALTAGLRMTW
jgi:uncharacterized protein with beta-barrel porin domain